MNGQILRSRELLWRWPETTPRAQHVSEASPETSLSVAHDDAWWELLSGFCLPEADLPYDGVSFCTTQTEKNVNADNLVVTVKDCVETDFFFSELLVCWAVISFLTKVLMPCEKYSTGTEFMLMRSYYALCFYLFIDMEYNEYIHTCPMRNSKYKHIYINYLHNHG